MRPRPPLARPRALVVPPPPTVPDERPINPIKALSAGRPKVPRAGDWVPTDRERGMVEELAGLGFTQEQVARVLNTSITTLRNHFDDELFLGKMSKLASVSQTMFAVATDPNNKGAVSAGKYILATQGGPQWRETKVSELVGSDGKPLRVASDRTVDPSLLSDEQRDALRDILTSALKLAGPQGGVAAAGQTIEGTTVP